MKKKIIYGSILATFLMVSIAFIQPVSAGNKETIDLIQTPEYDMQEVEALAEMICSDKQVLSYIEPLLEDRQISGILEQMQVATGPDEMYALLTELEALLIGMDLDLEVVDLINSRYQTAIFEGKNIIIFIITLIVSFFMKLMLIIGMIIGWLLGH